MISLNYLLIGAIAVLSVALIAIIIAEDKDDLHCFAQEEKYHIAPDSLTCYFDIDSISIGVDYLCSGNVPGSGGHGLRNMTIGCEPNQTLD